MNNNTGIKVYGAKKSDADAIIDNFDWKNILSHSAQFSDDKFNRDVYEFENIGSISARGRSIIVHPSTKSAFDKIKKPLARAISDHYKCRCIISGTPFDPVVKMWKAELKTEFGLKIGDLIEFGRYPQDDQPVKWRILNIEEDVMLLISEECLIVSGYCDGNKAYGNQWYTMWGNSLAREVCCGQFFYQAFNTEEKNIIVPKQIDEIKIGPQCKDEVFLLSEEEAELFMSDPQIRKAKPIVSATIQEQAPIQQDGYSAWWLLPQEDIDYGNVLIYPKAVMPDGEIQFHGRNIYHGDFMIRPSILVKTDGMEKYIYTVPKQKAAEYKTYSLAYIQKYEGKVRENRPGGRSAIHDKIINKWRMRIQLDDDRLWFLSVFVNDNGTFDKYSLDRETASDSHYEFSDEAALRKAIYAVGDEDKYLAEVLIGYIKRNGGSALLKALLPYVTSQYHFD